MATEPNSESNLVAWDWFNTRLEVLGYASLSEFATRNGFQKSSLSRYFHLQREIPSGHIGRLCLALEVSPHELLQAVGAIDWRHLP